MSVTLALATLFAAQSVTVAPLIGGETYEKKDASFEALADGKADAAITALKASLSDDPEDPALLINLGTAYQLNGDAERAAEAYRAAASSRTRYQLELADGSWVDSRVAAKVALDRLERSSVVAMR